MAMLEVIIGMIFTFMLLSLLGTTVNELLSAWRGWRGNYLEEGLKRLLEFDDDPSVFNKFKDNALFKQLRSHDAPLRMSKAPAWITSKDFANTLTHILKKKGETVEKVEDLFKDLPEESQLRQVLEQLKDEGYENLDAFKGRLQSWFDGVMAQSSGWYKRHLQQVTFVVGLTIAGVLNADSFAIYDHLTQNAAARQSLAAMAENYVEANEELPTPELLNIADTVSLTGAEIKAKILELSDKGELAEVKNILGLGWDEKDTKVGVITWGIRFLGWLITALAISLGAPFWFDILKKVVTIRSSGNDQQAQQIVINTNEQKK